MPTSTTTYTYNDLDISSRTSPIGGESDIAHTRIFWRNDGAPIFAIDDTKQAVKEGVIPVPDQYYIAPGSVTTQTWEQFARFRSYNLEQVDKYRYCFFFLLFTLKEQILQNNQICLKI